MEGQPLPVGVVVADEPGGGPGDRAKWLRGTLPLAGEGTGCTRPEQIVLPATAPLPWLPVLQVRAGDPVLLFLRAPTVRLPLPGSGHRARACGPAGGRTGSRGRVR